MAAITPITSLSGKGIHVSGADIDTDRIIPARFMKCVTFDGLGEYAFYDVRFDKDGNPTDHILNEDAYKDASILISGINFGCGSSREHAPQSLEKYGFKAIIAESFAEIFFGNCTGLGIPCVTATKEILAPLKAAVDADSNLEVTIDLENLEVSWADQKIKVEMPDSNREALTSGKYDPLTELLSNASKIEVTAEALPYV